MGTQILPPLQGKLSVSSAFGVPDAHSGAVHQAVDWVAAVGTPVYAVADGVITRSDDRDKVGGNRVELRTKAGDLAGYAHLDQRFVSEGQTVRAGQVIGTVGKTGKVTGAHLHFSFQKAGRYVDPRKYLATLADSSMYGAMPDMPDTTMYRDLLEWLTSRKDLAEGKTWREFIAVAPAGFLPRHTNDDLLKATDKLGITDKMVDTAQFPAVVTAAIASGAGSNPLTGVADFLVAISDPSNWAKFLAIIGGAGMIVWGGKMLYDAS